MRVAGFVAAGMALLLSGPALAQANWAEFTDRDQHFTVNFPGDPKIDSIAYKTEKGTSLAAKIYTAKDARGGEYGITVVDYTKAPDEVAIAIAQAAKAERAKGDLKYDAVEHQNNIKSQRISLALPNGRFLLAEALTDHGRLFIMEADTPPKVPPPSQFQASLQVLDDNGVAIRYKNPDSTERVR
jgi:hypothetical protein